MNITDKRDFARYSRDSLCEIAVGPEVLKGKVVDYSDGVGVLIKKTPLLVNHAHATITILDYEVEFSAAVAWTEDRGYHQRVGFKRLDTLKGNLKHYKLVDILLGLGKSRKTGVLQIFIGSTVKRIFVDNGLKIFASSSDANDRFGQYLLTHGIITLEEYNQASYLVEKNGERLGQVLIDLGYMKKSDLAPCIQNHLEEIIMSLFNINEGKFEFDEGPLPLDEPIKLNLSTANLIYKGIKKINSFPMIDNMCPSLDTVLNLSKNPLPIFRTLQLEYPDKKILASVNGINNLKTILSLSHVNNFETLKSIIALLTTGLITVKGEDEKPSKLPLEIIFGESTDTEEPETHEDAEQAEASIKAEQEETDVDLHGPPAYQEETEILTSQVPDVKVPQEATSQELDRDAGQDEQVPDEEPVGWTVDHNNIAENENNLREPSTYESKMPSHLLETNEYETAEESIKDSDQVGTEETDESPPIPDEEITEIETYEKTAEVSHTADEPAVMDQATDEESQQETGQDISAKAPEEQPHIITETESSGELTPDEKVVTEEDRVRKDEEVIEEAGESPSVPDEELAEVETVEESPEISHIADEPGIMDQESDEEFQQETGQDISEEAPEEKPHVITEPAAAEELVPDEKAGIEDNIQKELSAIPSVKEEEQQVPGTSDLQAPAELTEDETKPAEETTTEKPAVTSAEERDRVTREKLISDKKVHVKSGSRKKLVMAIVVILIIIGAAVPMVLKFTEAPTSPPATLTADKTDAMPHEDTSVSEQAPEAQKTASPYPTFREDALKKFLRD